MLNKKQVAWNKGLGGCKRGHESSLYISMPSGVKVCLACKRENGARYRAENQKKINLSNRVKRYKIDIDAFRNMYRSQNGLCAICKREIDLESCKIDHSHENGEVRGILCTSCNTGIGLLQDSPDILIFATDYLRKR